jgi:hypothetical protein
MTVFLVFLHDSVFGCMASFFRLGARRASLCTARFQFFFGLKRVFFLAWRSFE